MKEKRILRMLWRITRNTNSFLTESIDTDKPFLIVESWDDLGKIQREINRRMHKKLFKKWNPIYNKIYGNRAFEEMRFGHNKNNELTTTSKGHWPYLVPTGLTELDNLIDWGFSDEHCTCTNCGKSFTTTPSYYGDKLNYATIEDELFCTDCIRNDLEDIYINNSTNNPKAAINTNIITEERLEKLGWTKNNETYINGLSEGSTETPKEIMKKYKNKTTDILFTYAPTQFDVYFWIWTKHKEE
jgi:hypothetical protein